MNNLNTIATTSNGYINTAATIRETAYFLTKGSFKRISVSEVVLALKSQGITIFKNRKELDKEIELNGYENSPRMTTMTAIKAALTSSFKSVGYGYYEVS